MNYDWSRHWLDQAKALSMMSKCPRGKVGAFIIDQNNSPVSAGLNGPPRKSSGELCGDHECYRDSLNVKSGTRIEVGCHHAEQNAICNAAKKGVSLNNTTMIISTFPCLLCAKLIHHSGISAIIVPIDSLYSREGIDYLLKNKIRIDYI